MSLVDRSKWVSLGCSLALLTMVGCKSSDTPSAEEHPILYPQTSEKVVVDPAHAPQEGAIVVLVYDDKLFGKTEVRTDDYLRHVDTVSPTGWTPWHYKTAPHHWTEPPMTYESSVSGSWTSTVKAVDVSKRLITLEGPSGMSETFIVGPQVERLKEVSVGDKLAIGWSATLYGELRAPTAEEIAEPIKLFSVVNHGSSDAAPVGSEGTALRVVTTVDVIDLAGMNVTLKGPLGNRVSIHAKNPENIRKLHVGDTVVVRYSQGVALALTKAP